VTRRCRLAFALLAVAAPAGAAPDATLSATTQEPRAFGYQVGDLVSRSVSVRVPEGLVLDAGSLPRAGVRAQAFELRRLARLDRTEPGGQRIELTLHYQVFVSPPQVRTLELPPFTLQFKGAPRDESLRIDAWPVTIAPLAPVEASPRRGLGELQPDAEPPPIDTAASRHRLVAWLSAALIALGWLAFVYFGLPWWSRTQRPFAQAWRSVRGLPASGAAASQRSAYRQLHEALNRSAGEVLFAPGVARFIAARPQFEALRADLALFFERSQLEFFGSSPSGGDLPWLVDLCRRCRDAERGTP
jgi:mxaA protein